MRSGPKGSLPGLYIVIVPWLSVYSVHRGTQLTLYTGFTVAHNLQCTVFTVAQLTVCGVHRGTQLTVCGVHRGTQLTVYSVHHRHILSPRGLSEPKHRCFLKVKDAIYVSCNHEKAFRDLVKNIHRYIYKYHVDKTEHV